MRDTRKEHAKKGVTSLFQSEKGATAIEYGLIVSLIVIAIVITVQNVADATINMWTNVSAEVVNNS
ncbi:MAG: Flp family type IVb pilin [Sphingobium sp.]